ncbi:hypothetical protein [Haloferula sp. A504]|uniref:hypothetical protein n=1 Tax=Haloferula sp. A504 TaxID=3373601 RepID=UPI0031C102C3|nr:hypothetical protein [Verrucomicrobiaceae bacterium E54]
MRWLERMEDRLHWVAIPGLFKYLAMLGVLVSAVSWINPDVASIIAFDRAKILDGEYWRLLSFGFAPMGVFGFSVFGVLFLVFATFIAFLVSDSLEEVWGPTRTTLYLLSVWVGLMIGPMILDPHTSFIGTYLYLAMFFAFATYFPRYEFRLFAILPVQVRWLAWIGFGIMVLSLLGHLPLISVVLPTLLPYGLWVLPTFLRDRKALAEAGLRRRKFQSKALPEDQAFHRCAECDRTELTDPELDFRTMLDGTEYCVEHLPADSEP